MRSMRYDVYGAAIGIALPIVGTAMEAWKRHGGVSPAALWTAFSGQPLLWVMSTTPLVLGGLGYALVRQHGEIVRQSEEIVRQSEAIVALEQTRRESFHRTASELFASAQGLLGNVSNFTATATETASGVRETTATLHGLAQTASSAALTAEQVIGIALQAERTAERGRDDAEAGQRQVLQLADEVRALCLRIEELDGKLAEVFTAAASDGPGARLPFGLDQALAAARRAMGTASEAARLGGLRATAGIKTAGKTVDTVDGLADALRQAAKAAREIARVAQQQEQEVEQVLRSMSGISHATEGTMASTQEVAKEARALNELATALRQAVKAAPEVAASPVAVAGPGAAS